MSFCPDSHMPDIVLGCLRSLGPIGGTLKVQLFSCLVEADRLEVAKEVLSAKQDMRAKRSECCAQEQLLPKEENIDSRHIEVLDGCASRSFAFLP